MDAQECINVQYDFLDILWIYHQAFMMSLSHGRLGMFHVQYDFFDVLNTELNDSRKIIVWENQKFLLKELQFIMSFRILQSMAYAVCHASTLMTS